MNKVAVLIGSDTDRSTMEAADKYYEHFGIDCEILTMSAHRNPVEVHDFCTKAPSNGYKILVGAAGMAAHLAGAIKANSILPVIGVPLDGGILTKLDGSAKGGVVFQLYQKIGLKIQYIGYGEGLNDLDAFETNKYVNELIGM